MKERTAAGSEGPEPVPYAPPLGARERRKLEQQSSPNAVVIHEVIRAAGEGELRRTPSGLAWSGLAAGLSMGFSLVTQGLLRDHLPDDSWSPILTSLGYSVGFLIVILGRQQLFTENTLTVILPLLARRNATTLLRVLRLWAVVLTANIAGALAFAWVAGHTEVFDPATRAAFDGIGLKLLSGCGAFGAVLLRAMFAGWLIALMVWVLPSVGGSGRIAVIVIVTWLIGLAGFPHIVAGSVDTLYVVVTGGATWTDFAVHFFAPTLLGNILGGVSLVAVINYAQVIAGIEDRPE